MCSGNKTFLPIRCFWHEINNLLLYLRNTSLFSHMNNVVVHAVCVDDKVENTHRNHKCLLLYGKTVWIALVMKHISKRCVYYYYYVFESVIECDLPPYSKVHEKHEQCSIRMRLDSNFIHFQLQYLMVLILILLQYWNKAEHFTRNQYWLQPLIWFVCLQITAWVWGIFGSYRQICGWTIDQLMNATRNAWNDGTVAYWNSIVYENSLAMHFHVWIDR